MLIGLSRVSSSSQDHASQIDALNRAGCEKIFYETQSGTKDDRAELKKMLEFARPGDSIVVVRLDRLARNVRKLLEVVDELKKRDIGLQSLTEHLSTDSAQGRLALQMWGVLAEFEAAQTKARCAAGRAAAIARGRMGGRPRSLDENKLRIARALWADQNLSAADVAATLKCAPSTLYRTLGSRGAMLAANEASQSPVDQEIAA